MKYLAPVLATGAAIVAGITTALAQAHGAFTGNVSLKPYLFGYGASGALFLAAIVIAIINSHREVIAAKIKVTPIELRRTVPHERNERHIFLRAKIELLEPARAKLMQCRMELSRTGAIDTLQYQDDLKIWEITNWSTDPIPHEELRPFPKTLKCGEVVEGWVHFRVARSDRELDCSRVRFFVDTKNGTGTGEVPEGHEYWNVSPNRMVMERD